MNFSPTAVDMHNDNLIYDRRHVFVLKQLTELRDGERQESSIGGGGRVGRASPAKVPTKRARGGDLGEEE